MEVSLQASVGKEFLDRTQKMITAKEKKDKFAFLWIKNFSS